MECMSPSLMCWLWWSANAAAYWVGAAVVVRRFLVPWSCWLGRRALCWCRYALSSVRGDAGPDMPRAPPVCRCCGGVYFDDMAGGWAVVTGCTDGIGKQYAIQLADRGMNVALVSRNADKLRAIAQQIHERHGDRVKTKTVVADFTSLGGDVPLANSYNEVRHKLGRMDVRLLVNNAGVSYARPERLLDLAPSCTGALPDPCRDVVECNTLATVAMCRIVMPLMVDGGCSGEDADGDRPQQSEHPATEHVTTSHRRGGGGGVVINVSSASAQLPCPLLSVYGATKAFVEKFSVELAAEYDVADSKQQIGVRCLTPGFVATKMSRIRSTTTDDTSWMYAPSPQSYASHSLRALDCHCACGWTVQRRPRAWTDRNGGKAGPGLLERTVSAVFDSPSSPMSAGRSGVTTTGYPSHTLMLIAVNAVRWIFGNEYLTSAAGRMMCGVRDRIARHESAKMQKPTSSAESKIQSRGARIHD
ncbi:very-long-chain 3-oxoacyl-CoA reductase-like [Rhopalosiphum maidis]|uniref:very-long-chain 3-oxoacyl-CoA reductase-like n=1 Tax=Rhopalosiphum maidis TaxID=43146 RepID=UPI000EFE474F|nr:very-long-chain 3-oxoacyl-CoA reductase-like [Rhopalosiphum maidis]